MGNLFKENENMKKRKLKSIKTKKTTVVTTDFSLF